MFETDFGSTSNPTFIALVNDPGISGPDISGPDFRVGFPDWVWGDQHFPILKTSICDVEASLLYLILISR